MIETRCESLRDAIQGYGDTYMTGPRVRPLPSWAPVAIRDIIEWHKSNCLKCRALRGDA